MPTVADFYHSFTSETGCCFSLTALNEIQLQTSMSAVRIRVCVFLTKSLWEKPDPNSLPANRLEFSFFSPFLPHYVLFTPLEAARPPFSPYSSTDPL